VIQSAYNDGLKNEGDSVKIDEGFHPDFRLLGKGYLTALRKYDIADLHKRQINKNVAWKLPRATDKKLAWRWNSLTSQEMWRWPGSIILRVNLAPMLITFRCTAMAVLGK
tara:strand:- start:215 stop:544 length:330 start_codon:yes stop_codon:yes gene_type:complete